MRIKAISLSWFRGAADPVSLEPGCKSMVVYGVNGSGKSSFVDALEYALNDGRISHLAHEYSGKRQEKAVPNTHVPEGRKPGLSITFADDSELRIEIQRDGTHRRSGGEAAALGTWDYRRTVLRQDEVAAFIHDTKGGKYSALLPLLGLRSLEVAAENFRQLAKSAGEVARTQRNKGRPETGQGQGNGDLRNGHRRPDPREDPGTAREVLCRQGRHDRSAVSLPRLTRKGIAMAARASHRDREDSNGTRVRPPAQRSTREKAKKRSRGR